MAVLLLVITLSLSVSFLCSVLEVVLLSLTHAYVAVLEQRGTKAGQFLAELRQDIDRPISAILTLNTIAHTVGAAVSGAIALKVLGSEWMALFSALLTIAILVLSEIIPKTFERRSVWSHDARHIWAAPCRCCSALVVCPIQLRPRS